MAQYQITLTIAAARQSVVEKKLRAALGNDVVFTVVKDRKLTSRADRLSEAESFVEDAKGIVEELRDEMQNWYDSMPENLQNGEKANQVQEAIDNLENVTSELEGVDFQSVEFPGMY